MPQWRSGTLLPSGADAPSTQKGSKGKGGFAMFLSSKFMSLVIVVVPRMERQNEMMHVDCPMCSGREEYSV
jgi:hypothetical protein